MAPDGDGVGGVRKAGRALVGRNHEIGVVAIAATHVGRRDDHVAVEIVGDVEQRLDEDGVAGGAFAQHRFAVGSGRHQARHEGALGAHRHDDGVLDLLRLDQPQHFGPEILRPVRPAEATTCNRAEAQMEPLHPRRIDKDFAIGARRWQAVDLAAVELDREGRAPLAVAVALEGVGPYGRFDEVEEPANDAVFIERLRRLERGEDRVVRVSNGAFAID